MIGNMELVKQYNILNNNIKKFRKEKNLTQEQLAELADLSASYIKQIESTHTFKNVSLTTLLKLSKALNVDIKDLFN